MKKLLREINKSGAVICLDEGRLSLEGGTKDLRDQLTEVAPELLAELIPTISKGEAVRGRLLVAEMAGEVRLVTTKTAAKKALRDLLAAGDTAAIDTETAVKDEYRGAVPVVLTKAGTVAKKQSAESRRALDPRYSRIRLVQVAVAGLTVVFDMNQVPLNLVAPLFAKGRLVVGHNLNFDMQFLLAASIKPKARLWDTMLAARHIDGTLPRFEVAVRAMLDLELPKGLGGSDWGAKELSPEQLDYAVLDAAALLRLYEAQRDYLLSAQKDDPDDPGDRRLQSHERSCQAIVPVAAMSLNGMCFDLDLHAARRADWRGHVAQATTALDMVTSGRALDTDEEVRAYVVEEADGATLAQWDRVKKARDANGQRKLSVAAPVLKLNRHLPGINELLTIKKYKKLQSSFGDGLAAQVHPETGRIHPSFRLMAAITGRMSCSTPNVQQAPRDDPRNSFFFRDMFGAAPGHTLIAADYNQIELRIAAELSGDENMRRAYRDEKDLHRWTAALVTGKEPEDTTDDERKKAKAQAFGLLYGAQAKGFSRYSRSTFGLDMDVQAAHAAIADFWAAYPQLREWQEHQKRTSQQYGYTETVDGRRWYWEWSAKNPEDVDDDIEEGSIWWWNAVTGYRPTFALNQPVQGAAATVMMNALAYLHEALPPEAKMIAVIHDEVLIEAPDDPAVVKRAKRILKTEMTKAFSELFPEAPCGGLVSPTSGANWGEQ